MVELNKFRRVFVKPYILFLNYFNYFFCGGGKLAIGLH